MNCRDDRSVSCHVGELFPIHRPLSKSTLTLSVNGQPSNLMQSRRGMDFALANYEDGHYTREAMSGPRVPALCEASKDPVIKATNDSDV
jgi:hypothetical protein